MTWKRFGRAVSLVTDKATSESFAIGLEAVQSGRGTLVAEPQTDYSGDGIRFQKGDVLFGKLRPYLAKAWHADRHGAAVGDFHVYRPNNGVYGNYVKYVLLSRAFLEPVTASVTGAKMPRVDWHTTRAVECFMPPEDEQRAIADFLDEQTSRIDTLIDKQTQLIATLRERRTAVIVQGVTGYEPGSPAPVSWSQAAKTSFPTVPLRHFARLATGTTPSGDHEEIFHTDVNSLGWATPEDLTHDVVPRLRLTTEGAAQVRPLPAGAVLVCCIGATLGKIGFSVPAISTNQQITGLIPYEVGRYLYYALVAAADELTRLSVGNTLPILNNQRLATLTLPKPSVGQQRRIADELDEQTAKIDTLITKTEQHIALAKERRSALITAAVTGQIDVRTAARAEKVGT